MKNAIWIFIFAVVILFIFLPPYSRMQDLKKMNADYERQIVELKEKRVRLLEEKRLLEDDPVYLEKIAREKMGLIREGEVIYRLKPKEKQ